MGDSEHLSRTGASDPEGEGSLTVEMASRVAPDSEDLLSRRLDVFLNTPEEDATSFIAGLTALTEEEKTVALARLERPGDTTSSFAEAYGNNETTSSGLTTSYTDLRRRVRERVQQCRKEAKQLGSSASRSSVRADTLTLAPSPGRGRRHFEAAGRASFEAMEVSSELGIETVELQDGIHTGNIVAFFDHGVTQVPTNFDNFLEEGAAVLADGERRVPEVHIDPTMETLPRHVPTLDEILDLTDELPNAGMSSLKVSFAEPVKRADKVTDRNTGEGFGVGARGETSSGASSSGESVDLPGLEDRPAPSDSTASASTPHGVVRVDNAMAADLHSVIAEQDDCVQTFSLDPVFDYDADLFGAALRSGKPWRQVW